MSVQDIKDQIGKYEDHSITGKAKTRDVIPAGKTVCRLIEYIDLGVQPQRPYNQQPRPPKDTVKLVFELLGPKNIKTVETDEGERKYADKLYLTLTKSNSGKSKFKKLFNKLRYDRPDINHFVHMLGDAFTVTITHSQWAPPGGVAKVYANPTVDGEYSFGAPIMEDPLTGDVVNLNVPQAISPLRAFAWQLPTLEDWDALFIDGVYTNSEGEEVSKNFIQGTILNAQNFEGSPLATLLEERAAKSAGLDSATDALAGTV